MPIKLSRISDLLKYTIITSSRTLLPNFNSCGTVASVTLPHMAQEQITEQSDFLIVVNRCVKRVSDGKYLLPLSRIRP